ncbi:MAG: CRTAC1 family protein [Bryobacterales bacterium]|nr:CRTAC1 family protein [Bryobacterales bacterium]
MRLTRRSLLTLLAGPAIAPLRSQAAPMFEEIPASKSGITWVHDNALSESRFMPEAIGPGCAFFDFDNDGWMDIYLVNSGPSDFYKPKAPIRNALYRNNRDGTFTDVTLKAGVAGANFGMGAAAADFDNDGHTDLLVTGYGPVTLYRNNGDGTFTDISKKAGLDRIKTNWTTSAVWFDYDNDGYLDLFLCSYVDFGPPGNHAQCEDNRLGRKYYCVPRVFKPTACVLLHNNGNGTFTDVTAQSGIAKSLGKALGVVATDVNNDGLLDLFVANDTVQNFLFMNRGKGKWEEIGLASEVAFGENGQARSGMGVDARDFDNDGWEDLFVTNIDQEMYSLYKNNRDETFADVAHRHGIAQATRTMSGWGLKLFDFDNDGEVDLLLANGHPDDMIENYSQQIRYRMPMLLFRNEGGKMRNISAEAGPIFSRPLAARGMAMGDFNNDGRVDVLVGLNGGAPVLLRNNAGTSNHWLGIRLVGKTCNRDAIGARINWTAGGVKRTRLKTSGGSYLASHDPREVLGLGSATLVDTLEIRWPAPSKRVDRLTKLPVDRYITITESEGVIVTP